MQKTLRQAFKHEYTDAEDIACHVQDLWKGVDLEGEEYYKHVDCRPKVLMRDVLALAVPLAEKVISMETGDRRIKIVANSLLTTIKDLDLNTRLMPFGKLPCN